MNVGNIHKNTQFLCMLPTLAAVKCIDMLDVATLVFLHPVNRGED